MEELEQQSGRPSALRLEGNTANILQTVLPEVEKPVGEMHCCPRGLFEGDNIQ
jgi:hypothetical protein